MQDVYGWVGFAISQVIAWPQLLRLRRIANAADGISLLTYGLLLVSMGFWFVHALTIGDRVSVACVAVCLLPNSVIFALVARSRARARRDEALLSRDEAMRSRTPAPARRLADYAPFDPACAARALASPCEACGTGVGARPAIEPAVDAPWSPN